MGRSYKKRFKIFASLRKYGLKLSRMEKKDLCNWPQLVWNEGLVVVIIIVIKLDDFMIQEQF